MANSPVYNVRAEKMGGTHWSKMHRFSFQKIDLHFNHWNPGPNRPILRGIRGRNILPVVNAIKRGLTFNTTITKMALPLIFFKFFSASINNRMELK